MAQKDVTTITVRPDTRDELFDHKQPGDSYDDALRRVLERVGEA